MAFTAYFVAKILHSIPQRFFEATTEFFTDVIDGYEGIGHLRAHSFDDYWQSKSVKDPGKEKPDDGYTSHQEEQVSVFHRPQGQQVPRSYQKRADGVEIDDQAEGKTGRWRIDDRRDEEPELYQYRQGRAYIGVEHADGGQQEPDGHTEQNQHQDGRECQQHTRADRYLEVYQHGGENDRFDRQAEEHIVEGRHDQRFTREVDLGQHGFGRLDRFERGVDAICEDLPQNRADQDEEWIGDIGLAQVENAARLQDDEDQAGQQRRQKCPQYAEHALAIAGGGVPYEEPPCQFPRFLQVMNHRLEQFTRRTHLRFRRIYGYGNVFVGCSHRLLSFTAAFSLFVDLSRYSGSPTALMVHWTVGVPS